MGKRHGTATLTVPAAPMLKDDSRLVPRRASEIAESPDIGGTLPFFERLGEPQPSISTLLAALDGCDFTGEPVRQGRPHRGSEMDAPVASAMSRKEMAGPI